jgi:hypothetical protein
MKIIEFFLYDFGWYRNLFSKKKWFWLRYERNDPYLGKIVIWKRYPATKENETISRECFDDIKKFLSK